jgi:H/ACA ribonucleoprotein complex subunit 3
MIKEVIVEADIIRLTPNSVKGEGGEAIIYGLPGKKALKIFKEPDHPDFAGKPEAQQAALARINQHQKKLPAIPKSLPSSVIVPDALAFTTDHSKKIAGYRMPFISGTNVLLEYGDQEFRAGISNDRVRNVFAKIHEAFVGLHAHRVILGDVNPLNILVLAKSDTPYIIDIDSASIDGFPSFMFTQAYIDPLLCDPSLKEPKLVKHHTTDSDWYSFCVMLMQCMLFVHPYGGIYKPVDKTKKIAHTARCLHKISVFNPEVGYPKTAIHYSALSDELCHYLIGIFEQGKRSVFPVKCLEEMRWTKCNVCGQEYSRSACPNCVKAPPIAVIQTVTVRKSVTVTQMFNTTGSIVFATVQRGRMLWLYHEADAFRREDRTIALKHEIDPRFKYRINGISTVIGRDGSVVVLTPNKTPVPLQTDIVGERPAFDANADSIFWTTNDRLNRNAPLGPEYIGAVISGLTHIWVGSTFGFGFYRAGELNIAFIFRTNSRGINDSVKVPRIRGQLIDATCSFTEKLCWFFTSSQESGQTINRCAVIQHDGTVLASAEAIHGDGSWLSGIRGATAAGNVLLAPTDDGVVQVKCNGNQIVIVKEFPDTEPFVNSGSRLFAAADGLYVVGRRDIVKLKIS